MNSIINIFRACSFSVPFVIYYDELYVGLKKKNKGRGKKWQKKEKNPEKKRPILLNRNKMFKYRIHEFEIWCFPLSDVDGVKKKKSTLLLLQFKSLGRNINYPPGYYF